MKIAYVANFGNRGSDDTEGHIAHALEQLGHEVLRVPQTGSPAGCGNADLMLFHHWYNVNPGFLASLPMPKVCWYFDKVWNGRDEWIRKITPLCTKVFMTDGTWAAASGLANVEVLRQGIGDRDATLGKNLPHVYPASVAFTGSCYGARAQWAARLKARYGSGFRIFNDVFNRDLYDLCASVPIIVAPPYPSDDGYWSNRIYLILGSGGFLVHPRLAGLASELEEGVHFAGYASDAELFETIDYYLRNGDERDKIAAAGYARMHERFTFRHRCQALLSRTIGPANTGTLAR
jgi:hypothetical protein